MGKHMNRRQSQSLIALLVALVLGALGIGSGALPGATDSSGGNARAEQGLGQGQGAYDAPQASSRAGVPEYSGKPFAIIGASEDYPYGKPSFTEHDIERAEKGTFESYTPLDSMGRCGTALACLGPETLPRDDRGSIREIKPTGWRQKFYDFVDQEALYNRCHLIAWSLSGENANARNLITGTRSMNTQGMLPFEEETLSYIRRTRNHVIYRATPIFEGRNMVASGVHLEGESLEDYGEGISFNIYCYNVEPGVKINYKTGENWAE